MNLEAKLQNWKLSLVPRTRLLEDHKDLHARVCQWKKIKKIIYWDVNDVMRDIKRMISGMNLFLQSQERLRSVCVVSCWSTIKCLLRSNERHLFKVRLLRWLSLQLNYRPWHKTESWVKYLCGQCSQKHQVGLFIFQWLGDKYWNLKTKQKTGSFG